MDSTFALLQVMLESLPISSSSHLQLIGLTVLADYDRLLHGPTVLVIFLYFLPELWTLFFRSKHAWKSLLAWIMLIVFANSWTVLVYALLEKYAVQISLSLGFFITGLLLVCTSFFTVRRAKQDIFDHKKNNYLVLMAIIGVVQGAARLSGISRLGSTYSIAIFCGFSPSVAFRISCALQAPLFVAGFLEGALGLYKQGLLYDIFTVPFLGIILCGMVGAYFLLWLVEWLIITQRIWLVGMYMIGLSVFTFLNFV
jgi:undecaprenyl pyrophosphate phosphatase UppP